VLVPNPEHHRRGDYGIDPDGRLADAEPRFTYSGIARLAPELFAGLAPGRRPLVSVFAIAIARGQLTGVLHRGLWFDVGTPERLAAAASALSSASASSRK
jgi:MurNAc alpha-1-phosphate uridylyltransferase